MKKILLVLSVLITVATNTQAQNKKAIIKDTITVQGVCGDCKTRIQEAAYSVKGVKSADWNKETHLLQVVYSSKKTNLAAIAKVIANAGHDNRMINCTTAQYVTLPRCCRYRDGAKCDHD